MILLILPLLSAYGAFIGEYTAPHIIISLISMPTICTLPWHGAAVAHQRLMLLRLATVKSTSAGKNLADTPVAEERDKNRVSEYASVPVCDFKLVILVLPTSS